ncbi:hypothetical protein ACFYP4_02740 [Streptomyces sp. NPDC005551]|uniref:hypothetical protein n=1 Tax=Streptomyces sp. NPDC005551 TaxID=3364725 RepID=UPI00368720A2
MSMQPDPYVEKLRQWALLKAQVNTQTTRMNKLRDDLMETVTRDGDRDETGSVHWKLPSEFEVAGKTFTGIKREARTSTVLNEDRALDFAKERQIWDDVVVMTPTIDLDALYVAHQQNKLTEAELDGLFDTKVSYAFKPESS